MSTSTPAPQRTPARHPVSIGHLVMGIALLGLVGVWALHAGGVVEGGDTRWLLPAPWVLAGIAGLAALVASDRRRGRAPTGSVPPPVPDTSAGPSDPAAPATTTPADDGAAASDTMEE